MQIDFQQVFQTLKQGITTIAEKGLKDYIAAASKDGVTILNELRNDLERWTLALASGDLTKADFADLLLGQKDELQLVALKQAGLAQIAADQFKQDVFDLITRTVFALIP